MKAVLALAFLIALCVVYTEAEQFGCWPGTAAQQNKCNLQCKSKHPGYGKCVSGVCRCFKAAYLSSAFCPSDNECSYDCTMKGFLGGSCSMDGACHCM